MKILGKKKVESQEKGEMFKFNFQGETLQGVVLITKEIVTKYGTTETLEIMGLDGKKYFIILSAGLKYFDWAALHGKPVEITYAGDKENEKTKQVFKNFEVYELEVEED